MKNLTEFSGLVLRRAADVRAQKLSELKAQLDSAPAQAETPALVETTTTGEADAAPVDAASVDAAPVEAAPVEAASVEAASVEAASVEAASVEAAPVEAAPVEAAPVEAASVEAASVEAAANTQESTDGSQDAPAAEISVESGSAVEDASAQAPTGDAEASEGPRVDEGALTAAVAEEMGLSEDRAKYIMGALKAVGRKHLAQVRNIRVFQGETGPAGSYSVDDLHFVVDKIVAPAQARPGRDDRKGGGKGGKGRDSKGSGRGGPGGGGGGGGGPRPSGGRATGGFDGMSRDERPGDVPNGGLGWSLSRAPGDKKEGRGKPPRKGPRRGKPDGDRPNNARPGGGRPGSDKPGGEGQRRNRGGRGRGPAKTPEVIVKPTVVTAPKPAAAPPEASAQRLQNAPSDNGGADTNN